MTYGHATIVIAFNGDTKATSWIDGSQYRCTIQLLTGDACGLAFRTRQPQALVAGVNEL